jgi:hypothetical protein
MEQLKALPYDPNEAMKLVQQIMIDHLKNIDLQDELLNRSYDISGLESVNTEKFMALHLKELGEILSYHILQWGYLP